jgi:hypothetical protein
MTITKEYWNLPKVDEVLNISQGANLTVFVDYADNPLFFGLGASDVTAISGVFVALLALVVSLWQGWSARKYNKLSVRPHLSVQQSILNSGKTLMMELKNDGLGPAVINSYSLSIGNINFVEKGERIKRDIQSSITKQLITSIMERLDDEKLKPLVGGNSREAEIMIMPYSTMVSAGALIRIIKFDLDISLTNDVLDSVLECIVFEVDYSDVYGKKISKKAND